MTNPNDQAFPMFTENYTMPGLTIREYFAANVLQALISEESNPAYFDIRAKEAVQLADELIKALNENTPPENE